MEILTNEQLCTMVKNGDSLARELLVEKNIPYVKQIARRIAENPAREQQFAICGIEADDLAQAGSMGLLSAADSYNPTNGVKFITYADKAIRSAMADLIRQYSKDTVWRLSVDKSHPQQIIYLDKPLEDDPEETIEDVLAVPSMKLPERCCIELETMAEVREALDSLPEREKAYARYRFGFEDSDAHPLTEAARHFRLSDSRARLLEKSLLKALRHELLVGIPGRTRAQAEDRLTKLLVAENELHAVELCLRSARKVRKKIAAAVFDYLADCDGAWGQLRYDYSEGQLDVVDLADWDTTLSRRFAARAAEWLREHPEDAPPERIMLTFISPEQLKRRS